MPFPRTARHRTAPHSRPLLLVGLVGLVLECAIAEDRPDAQPFLRIVRDESKQPISLQTAVVRYSADATSPQVTVDLVGAVHLGEKAYYDALNRLFLDYDAVLYELVAPPDSVVPRPGKRSGHPVSVLQLGVKNLLGLEFQLDAIRYQRGNMVHADLSPEEFAKSMEERGESFARLLFRLLGQGMAQQAADPARGNDVAFWSALFSKNQGQDLKRALAVQFEELERGNAVLDGPGGSTIITERNRRAVQVLEKQLSSGKRRVAIFYGAAHLPDFDRRFRTQFGWKPVQKQWLEAWDLRKAPSPNDQ